jgi:hypothetical protein
MSKREPQVIAKDVNERYPSVKWPKDLLKFTGWANLVQIMARIVSGQASWSID